ncbi:MAG: hypothetical protein L0Y68_04095 [Candidatus Dadabacteria bacterium]|nr:hypothetical protein [Candidatus Dadabacteria bacterium]
MDNGQGSTAVGYFTDPWNIEVPKWNVTGTIGQGGRRITWTNGTEWTRFPQSKTHISGRWYHGNKPTFIDVYDNGWRFSITNELGQTNNGTAQNPHTLYIPSLKVTGYINRDATKIEWTNGTTWTRHPAHGGGGSGPLTAPPN